MTVSDLVRRAVRGTGVDCAIVMGRGMFFLLLADHQVGPRRRIADVFLHYQELTLRCAGWDGYAAFSSSPSLSYLQRYYWHREFLELEDSP